MDEARGRQPDTVIHAVAVIPARGGSKGIPGKNLALIGGHTLIARAVDACRRSRRLDAVVVSTDDAEIAREAARAGAVIVDRPADLADDLASSEAALLHAVGHLEREWGFLPRTLAFVQCTSPFVPTAALDRAIERVEVGSADVVFSACPSHAFLWRPDESGAVSGVNHDHGVRQRRQDRPPEWRETGAFYVMNTNGFRAAAHRFFGRIEIEPVDPMTSLEIDDPLDLDIARALDRARTPDELLANVAVVVTDFDGVHTDDKAIVSETGQESVVVSRRDGHGVKLLREAGVRVLILSTEQNSVVAQRAAKLGVECLHDVADKGVTLSSWMRANDLDQESVAFLGNDVNDLACLRLVGVPACVADAHPDVRAACRYVTHAAGGEGAVREFAEAILAARSRAGG